LSREIFLYDVAGASLTQVTDHRNHNGTTLDPYLSQDGTFLTFASSATGLIGADNDDGSQEVFLYEIATRALSQITSTPSSGGGSFSPRLDASGSTIAFDHWDPFLLLGSNPGYDLRLYLCQSPRADLSITKTDNQPNAIPGQPVTYTIHVTNPGPDAITGATVTDVFSADLNGVAWACFGTDGGVCSVDGVGDIDDTVDLPVGGYVTYIATGVLDAGATGPYLFNTATVTLPPGSFDLDSGNNTATDRDIVGDPLFYDDFELGDTSAWSAIVP
jgi:uncharacterized repeat protein (TIGR01451 family)